MVESFGLFHVRAMEPAAGVAVSPVGAAGAVRTGVAVTLTAALRPEMFSAANSTS